MALSPMCAALPRRPEIPIDSNGNLASKTEGADVWGYEQNARNELTRITKNSVEQARFAYDPLGRRVEKVAGGVTTSDIYDRMDLLLEARGSSTFKYIHGTGIDEPLAQQDGAGALTYFHADGLGSVVSATNVSGAVTLTRRYDVWGNLEVGASEPGYAFTGREWDPEIQLYHYRARYYDSRSGRFASEDPIRLRGGLNPYRYVRNRPVNLIDPLGLKESARMPCPGTAESKGALAFVCCKGGKLAICYDPATTGTKDKCVVAHEEEHIKREHERRDGCSKNECDAPPCEMAYNDKTDYRREHCDMFYADYFCVITTPSTPAHHRKATIMRGVLCSRYDYLW